MPSTLRVLVYQRDPRSRRALDVVLRRAGLDVDVAKTARDALGRAAARPPDAAVIDHVPSVSDGAELCRRLRRRLREWSAIPLLVVADVDGDDEKVRVLQAGADHYITKPFAPRELVARVQATLRRAERGPGEPRIDLAGLEVDLAARIVRRHGVPIHLTPIEFRLLRVLLRHRGMIMHPDARDHVTSLAPFLRWEARPQTVVVDGRIVFVFHGYTSTRRYPYAELVDFGGGKANYVRAAALATVDGYSGQVNVYRLHAGHALHAPGPQQPGGLSGGRGSTATDGLG